MSVAQKDLFQLLLDNAESGQVAISRIDSSASITSDIFGDTRGNLMAVPFRSDEVTMKISITMKRKTFLQVNELLSRVMS